MTRQRFILLFLTCNVVMIFIHIQNHTNIVRQLYRKQRNEKEQEKLKQKKAASIKSLYTLKNPAAIKTFATTELNMKKIDLRQIKTVTFHEK